MDSKDFLLLVLDGADGENLTPIQIQKSLFLMSKTESTSLRDIKYVFEAYHYGPYSRQINQDIADLYSKGLVVRSPSIGGNWLNTSISSSGKEAASILRGSLAPEIVTYIRELVGWVRSQSFASLLRTVYNQYPEYRENSVFQG